MTTSSLWKNYYKQTFLDSLKKTNMLRIRCTKMNTAFTTKADLEELCHMFLNLFDNTCELIKYFLAYQGIFQFENRDIIKEAFYVGLIEDGEFWINILSLAEAHKIKGLEPVKNLLIAACQDEYFANFYSLQKYFANKVEILNDKL